MKTIVISGFPGVGKTHYNRHGKLRTWDMDSMAYSWIEGKVGEERNPDFPNNYIKQVKFMIGKTHVVFVSTHKEVRDALVAERIPFFLVYPHPHLKGEYLKRFKDRGSDESFIALMNANWDIFLKQLVEQPSCSHLLLTEGEYLDNAVDYITNVLQPNFFEVEAPILDELDELDPNVLAQVKEATSNSTSYEIMTSTPKEDGTYFAGVDYAKVQEELLENIPEIRTGSPTRKYEAKTVSLNGKELILHSIQASYRDIVRLAFGNQAKDILYTITYSKGNTAGSITPGEVLTLEDGLHIDCTNTNNA